MQEEFEHWRMAKLMIDRYGASAMLKSLSFANARSVAGDADGVGTWLGIGRAIGELQRSRRPGEALN